jgi:hypothetical protein
MTAYAEETASRDHENSSVSGLRERDKEQRREQQPDAGRRGDAPPFVAKTRLVHRLSPGGAPSLERSHTRALATRDALQVIEPHVPVQATTFCTRAAPAGPAKVETERGKDDQAR